MSELDILYQELILEHYKHPRNKEPISGTYITHENPSCGDSLKIKIDWDGSDRIKRVIFDGHGCAISMASASIMTELLSGRTHSEALEICNCALSYLRGDRKDCTDPVEVVDLGDLEALSGVRQFPLRVKCATLPWHGIEKELKGQRTVSSQ
ncbi:MAG: SUF system NifU family Fe-S cluster assembly protein [Spirochaetes bacterium]|nr:SUF system NifU family Fe-S cluster assembly protein [Spirochaetota bacterium]